MPRLPHVMLLTNGSMLIRAARQFTSLGMLGFSMQYLLSASHAVSQLAPGSDSIQWYCRVSGGQTGGAEGGDGGGSPGGVGGVGGVGGCAGGEGGGEATAKWHGHSRRVLDPKRFGSLAAQEKSSRLVSV